MEAFYTSLFTILAIVAFGLEFTKPTSNQGSNVTANQGFYRFRNNYLVVWSLMMAGDWFQGPYVYALYQHYGYQQGDIGRLFIAGFGASLVFGTVVGSLADKHGRRLGCLVYCVAYILSCITKHSPDYNILMLGRLLGGIATSLLFSTFESWVVAEHFARGYEGAWLSDLFSKAVFLGQGLMAIVAGLVANYFVDTLKMGPVAPFDLSLVVLAIGAVVIFTTWPENYGDQKSNGTIGQQFSHALASIQNDPKIALLGAMQSLFEASMYTFVFLWTPALAPHGESIPHGMIFSCFMVACMAGAAISARLAARRRPEDYMASVFLCAAAALAVPILVSDAADTTVPSGGSITRAGKIQMLAFLGFEVTVGVFWPSMMKMRSQYVPEEVRATVMNLFRVPLNLFVCVVLYNVDKFPMTYMFALCAAFLAASAYLQTRLTRLANAMPRKDEGKQLPVTGGGH